MIESKLMEQKDIDQWAKMLCDQIDLTNFFHDTSGSRFYVRHSGHLECKACGGLSAHPHGGRLTPDLEYHHDGCAIKALFT